MWCSVFGVCWCFVVRCLLLVVCVWFVFGVCCSLFVCCCALCALRVVCCFLFVVCCFLCDVLFVVIVRGVVFAVYGLLFVD